MDYKNTLKDYLKTEKIDKNGKKRSYELSYEFKEYKEYKGYKGYFLNGKKKEIIKRDPQTLTIKNTLDYIEENYVNKDFIEKRKLINDLVVFKTYKDKIELEMADFQFLVSILAICATIFCGILNGISTHDDIFFDTTVLYLLLYAVYIFFLYISDRVPKRTKYNKLKSINNVIFTLEAIKENLVEVPEDKAYKLVAKRLINEKPDECLDPNYYVMFWESLEDKSK